MPSRFKFRQRLGVSSGSRPASRASSPTPHPASPAPPASPMSPTSPGLAAPIPAVYLQVCSRSPQTTRASSPTLHPTSSGPPPSSIPPTPPDPALPVTVVQLVPSCNAAFSEALRRHTEILTPEEKLAFDGGHSIIPEQLLTTIKSHDDKHNDASRSRRCATRVHGFLAALDAYLGPVSIMAGHSPQITSLVVGGLKLIVQVRSRVTASVIVTALMGLC